MIESRTRRVAGILAFLGVFGGLVLAVSMRWGAGLSPDSVLYIAAARNLLLGKGLSVSFDPEQFSPLTHYPPIYPTLLAGVGLSGIDPVDGVRGLNAILFAANIVMAGFIVYLAVRSTWAAVFAALLFMTAHPVIQIHSMAWSEPLFLTFELLEIIFLAAYLDRPRVATLVSASLMAGLAFLARYGGAAVVATGAIAILLLNRAEWKRRLADALVIASLSCLPITAWLIRNFLLAGSPTNRAASFHAPGLSPLGDALETVSRWFFPLAESSPLRSIAALTILVASTYVYVMAGQRSRSFSESACRTTNIASLLCVFAACYGIILLVSISFFDAGIPIDSRILSPLYPTLLVLGVTGWACFSATKVKQRSIQFAGIALGAIIFCSQLAGAASWLHFSYRNGIGYASQAWRESPLVSRLRNLGRPVPVFTNAPEAVYLLTALPAFGIPAKVNPQNRLPNGSYQADLAGLRSKLQEQRGVLAYFSNISWRGTCQQKRNWRRSWDFDS